MEHRATELPDAQRAKRGLAMASVIVTYLHRGKRRQAKTQFAASSATWRHRTSSTWGATATGERKSEDRDKAAEEHRQPNRDEVNDLAPARGIAVLVGTAMWLAIIALVLLI